MQVQERGFRRKQTCWALVLNLKPQELVGINVSYLGPSFGILLLFHERCPEWSSLVVANKAPCPGMNT